MQGDEILGIIRRIARDFAPLLPGLRLEVVPPEGFRARMRGKPIIADQAMLRAVLLEEASGSEPGGVRRWGKQSSLRPAAAGGEERGPGRTREARTTDLTASGAGVPGGKGSAIPDRGGLERERGEVERGRKKREEEVAAKYPLYALPGSRVIMVEMESLAERVNREDRRLHRPLVEGLALREVLYLITSGQPLPEPRARAERILRRHWPFQYAALRSVGLTVTGFERPPQGRALGRDN